MKIGKTRDRAGKAVSPTEIAQGGQLSGAELAIRTLGVSCTAKLQQQFCQFPGGFIR